MDIRTKLVLALVAVSLASMFTLGAFTYGAARDLLRDAAVRQLEAVAESKKQDLQKVIVAWRDRVQLVASRTPLRQGLAALGNGAEGDEAAIAEMMTSLEDALESVRALRGISVHAADGRPLVTTGFVPDADQKIRPAMFLWAEEPVVYQNVSLDPSGMLLVTFVAPIRARGRLLGATRVVLSAAELVDVTDDYTGLGDTGETMMAMLSEEGDAVILNPLRHDPDASLSRIVPEERTEDPTVQAALGNEGIWREGARDYRGEEVWAATRYLEEFRWGIVVKVDTAEEIRPVTELRNTMGTLAVSLAAFAIVAGTVLGLYIARPIRALAEVARRIHEGELDIRARVESEDEVGLLARTFNEMTEELVEKNRILERRIREQSEETRP